MLEAIVYVTEEPLSAIQIADAVGEPRERVEKLLEMLVVEFDLPGVDPDSVDLDVERNVLTVRAERRPSPWDDTEMIAAERPRGVFSRQVILGDTLDTDRIQARYNAGVLTLRLPIAEKAKPRKIAITNADADRGEITA